MRVITVNVCGIRSAAQKGLFRWLARQRADFICLQETKSQEHQLEGHGAFADLDVADLIRARHARHCPAHRLFR